MSQTLELGNVSDTLRKHWALFLFVFCVFFFSHPFDIFFSIKQELAVEEIIESTQRGNIVRQVALLIFGIWSMVTILSSRRSPWSGKNLLALLIIFFLLLAFCGIAWAEDKPLTGRRLIVFLILCLGTFAFASRISFRTIIVFSFVSCGLILLIGLFCEIALGTFHPLQGDYRFSGGLHPNAQGLNCAVLSIASISLGKLAIRHRVSLYAAGIIALSFLFMTKSRMALTSVIFGLMAYWIPLSTLRSRVTLFFILTIGSICLYLIVGDKLIEIVKNTFMIGRTTSSPLSLAGRIPLWEQCLQYLARRPLLGYGYNAFWTPNHIWAISTTQEWGVGVAHSGYLEVALGTGIIGAGIYICVFLIAILRSINIFRTSREVSYLFALAVLILFCADSILESWATSISLPHFIILITVAKLGFFETS
jgi:exopolysaccharide production protein ExoQ